jgi:hypothetical protein
MIVKLHTIVTTGTRSCVITWYSKIGMKDMLFALLLMITITVLFLVAFYLIDMS